jgi:predicted ATPase
LESIYIDRNEILKLGGFKLGRSISNLYFTDKFMLRKNNLFSAENANEGALHVLFYLALIISDKTPGFFAIDNIETCLNPKLCRDLIFNISKLSHRFNKQVMITTHNPAILDGLNLHDPEQFLFVVKRNDEGHTNVKQIHLKPTVENQNLKLSELWMRGYLGGLPANNF